MMKFFTLKNSISLQFLLLVLLAVSSCKKEEIYYNLPVYGPDQVFYALTDNTIARYNASDVRTKTSLAISGLAATEKLLSIDFRPATGELYGVSSFSKIYVINLNSGVARAVATTPFTPNLAGEIVNIDFNPTVDRIRIVTNTGQNLRLNPETGLVVATDTNVGSTSIAGISYTNSYAGSTATVLYDIDATTKKLYKQDPPNNGTLVEVGNLKVNLGTILGFDISSNNANAFAIGKVGDSTKLYAIDLTKGEATLKGKFVKGTVIQSIAIPTSPVFYATDNANNFLIFNPNLTTNFYSKPITGLQTGETIVGMDMRPSKGQIYALGSSSRLYTVNIGTGEFTQVGSGAFSTLLNGTSFGFDFNPVEDVIRLVSNTGQNLRINPTTAAVTVDANITPITAKISAAAFSSNFAGATTTALYVIDNTTNKLFAQEPITGKITEIADLKIGDKAAVVSASNGFDIISSSAGNVAYGVFTVGTTNSLYTVDLSSGIMLSLGTIPTPVTSFTLGLRF
jgi:hypothetical protein